MLNSIEIGKTVYTRDGICGEVMLLDGEKIVLSCGAKQTSLLFALEAIERVKAYDEAAAEIKMKEKIQCNRYKF